jgi:Flp pilus assembly protein TadB
MRFVAAVIGGVVGAALTGWPIMAVLVPAAVMGLPILLGHSANQEIELLQALDRWIRGLTATLPTGKSITDAIRVSVKQAPAQLTPHIELLIARLDDRWTAKQALFAMADDLASADADAVLAALGLAAQRGGTGATSTLSALADAIQERLRALRDIEAERAKPRIVVRQVTIVTTTVLGAAMIFGRTFFEPYGSPLGQLLLGLLLATYVGSLVMLRRMTMPRQRQRILRSVT